jgi:hypothetical protein
VSHGGTTCFTQHGMPTRTTLGRVSNTCKTRRQPRTSVRGGLALCLGHHRLPVPLQLPLDDASGVDGGAVDGVGLLRGLGALLLLGPECLGQHLATVQVRQFWTSGACSEGADGDEAEWVGAGTLSDLGTKGGDMPTGAARTTSVRIMGLLQGSGVPQVRHPEWRLVHLAPPQ